MWAVAVSGKLISHFHDFSFAMKPLYYGLLFLSSKLASLVSIHPMYSARLLFAANAFFIIVLFCKLIKLKSNSLVYSLSASFLLLTSSLFVERSFRVRSDLLALSVLLSFVYLYEKRRDIKFLGLGFVIPLLITPKSFILFLFVTPQYYREILKGIKNINKKLSIAIVGPIGVGLLYYSQSKWFFSMDYSLSYFIESFKTLGAGLDYFSLERFRYVIGALFKSVLLDALILYYIVYSIYAKIKKSKPLLNAQNFTIVLVFMVIVFYPNRLPFFLVCLVVLMLLAIFREKGFVEHLRNMSFKMSPFIFICFVTLGMSLFIERAHKILSTNNNRTQAQISQILSDEYKRKELKVYDPAGILKTNR